MYKALASTAFSAGPSASAPAAKPGADFAASFAGAVTIADVGSNYDVRNISPREIDRMVQELRDADAPMTQDLMMLSTHGEEFRSHLSQTIGAHFNPVLRGDLSGRINDQLAMAQRHGDPVESYVSLLRYLDGLEQVAFN